MEAMLPPQGRVSREAWVGHGQQPAETFKEATLSRACCVHCAEWSQDGKLPYTVLPAWQLLDLKAGSGVLRLGEVIGEVHHPPPPPPTSHQLAKLYCEWLWAQLGPAASELGLLLGEGRLPVTKVPGFRLLAVGTVMLYSLFLVPSLLLLVMPVPSRSWSRPLWYQVGLDLQPWGCQPNNLDSCRSSLGCPGYWLGLGGSRIYPVAGVTITTTMMLVVSRVMLHRWRAKVTKGQLPRVTSSSCKHWKRQPTVSDRTLVLRVLHMLDAILLHIEGHLQRLASQQQIQIKGSPPESG